MPHTYPMVGEIGIVDLQVLPELINWKETRYWI